MSPASSDLLEWLRRHDNPFSDSVQPRVRGAEFERRHAPDVNREVLDQLRSIIKRFRLTLSTGVSQSIPHSGLTVVLGDRGSGKTHLVHALATTPGTCLLAPKHLETHRSFEEYVLSQLVQLLQDDTDSGGTMLSSVAHWLTRNVARHALRELDDRTMLGYLVHIGNVDRSRAQTGVSTDQVRAWREASDKALQLHDTAEHSEWLRPNAKRFTQDVCLRRIEALESGVSSRNRLRCGLFKRLVCASFARNFSGVFEHLLDGLAPPDAGDWDREGTVRESLRVLLELFLLTGTPLVLAFDGMEDLLGSPPDEKRCEWFFSGLASFVDSHYQGVPILLFVERGYWMSAGQHLRSYQRGRVEQGVLSDSGQSVPDISIPPLSRTSFEAVVQRRLEPVLRGHFKQGIPSEMVVAPFEPADLRAALGDSGAEASLRSALQRLRDRYDELVFRGAQRRGVVRSRQEPRALDVEQNSTDTTESTTCAAVDREESKLDAADWEAEFARAERSVDAESSGIWAQRLHRGVDYWFGEVLRRESIISGWKLMSSALETVGDHPLLGHQLAMTWKRGRKQRRLALAFLLGRRAGLPNDLRTKLEHARSTRKLTLVLVWPRGVKATLPAKSKSAAIWQELVTGECASRVYLEAVDRSCVVPFVALGALRDSSTDAELSTAYAFLESRFSEITHVLERRLGELD